MLSANTSLSSKASFIGRGLVEGSTEHESTYTGETLSCDELVRFLQCRGARERNHSRVRSDVLEAPTAPDDTTRERTNG